MDLSTEYAILNGPDKELGAQMSRVMAALQNNIQIEDLVGSRFRGAIIETLELQNLPGLLVLGDATAVIVEVSAPGNAFAKILDIMLEIPTGRIQRCIFITQTYSVAVYRNQIKNPGSTSTGNRIEFETVKRTLSEYCKAFLKIPVGIIGIGVT